MIVLTTAAPSIASAVGPGLRWIGRREVRLGPNPAPSCLRVAGRRQGRTARQPFPSRAILACVPRERDPFANFERMRRQIDELFGDFWTRPLQAGRHAGFTPRVDVYYCGDPPKVVVKADLAGIDIEDVSLELAGRVLIMSGQRRARDTEGRMYQQIEIEQGSFRREIQLGAQPAAQDAKATYEDGILRVELPLVPSEATRVHIAGTRSRSDPTSSDAG
jgi:HSP20 family protein